ncbi:cupin domain-containing protein [Symbioplanes lichenis]|uniref:cupin domain-containing protein n=1 Tax=Symbioplanes lichenis TaxID=1629072 RepID=UPI002738C1FD|nr:cupin domain-containing protein [Actinoplanes lichenis]
MLVDIRETGHGDGCMSLRGRLPMAYWREDTDELFLVVHGELTIQLRDGDVVLRPGQLFVVPRGVEHCPVADGEVHALLVEPAGVVNTGDAGGALTAAYDDSLM